MRRLSCLFLGVVLFGFAASPVQAGGGPAGERAVALVCQVAGAATYRSAKGAPPEPLALFRHLVPGAILETAPGATVTVVFFDGQRQAFGGSSRVVVHSTRLIAEVGAIRRLAPLPAVVDLVPLLSENPAGRLIPAGRIRGGGPLSGLRPHDGAKVRRDAAVLSFDVDPDVRVYHVEVVDAETDRVLFRTDLSVPPVRLPLRLLRPGALYRWSVESKVPPKPDRRGEAMFTTLSPREERAWTALDRAARRSGEPDLVHLLTEVDRRLGLTEPEPLAEALP